MLRIATLSTWITLMLPITRPLLAQGMPRAWEGSFDACLPMELVLEFEEDDTLDLQVTHEPNLAAIDAALAAGGNADATTMALEGLNHLFQPVTRGTVEEYAQITRTFDTGALQVISDWIRAHAGL